MMAIDFALFTVADSNTLVITGKIRSLAFRCHGHGAIHRVALAGGNPVPCHLSTAIGAGDCPCYRVAFGFNVLDRTFLIGLFTFGYGLIFFDALGVGVGWHFHGHSRGIKTHRYFPFAFADVRT